MKFLEDIQTIDAAQIDQRLQKILSQPISGDDKAAALRKVISLIDLTSLNGDDTSQKVASLCEKALNVKDDKANIPQVGAVCVYPNFAGQVSEALKGSGINTAVVATGFPSGQTFREVKLLEVQKAVEAGAREIDMVLSRGLFLEEKYQEVFDEIRQVKQACQSAHLKVILETGELRDLTQVYKASLIAMEAGADFIKTSTGKINPAATESAFLVMTDAIKKFFKNTGKQIGIKPAGGIAEAEKALGFYMVVKANLGEEWLNNELFRIGASRLLDNIIQTLKM